MEKVYLIFYLVAYLAFVIFIILNFKFYLGKVVIMTGVITCIGAVIFGIGDFFGPITNSTNKVYLICYLVTYLIVILIVIRKFKLLYLKKVVVITVVASFIGIVIFKFERFFESIISFWGKFIHILVKIDSDSLYYVLISFGIIIIGVALMLFLMSKERKKRDPFKKERWGSFKEYILRDRILSFAFSLLVVILGMIGAGLVNFLNADITDSIDLIRFIVSGVTGIIVIVLGIVIISPLLDFKFRYGFLENYENNNAQFIYNLRTISENTKNNNLGVISFQFFELTKHTSGNNIVYEFDEIWRNDSKYDKISKFKPQKIEVPMEILNIFKKDKTSEFVFSEFNKYTPYRFAAKLVKKKVYVPAPYLRALHHFLFEFFYKEKDLTGQFLLYDIEDLKDDNPIVIEFKEWIKDWKIPKSVSKKRNRYKSVHYLNFFEIKKFIQVNLDPNNDEFINGLSRDMEIDELFEILKRQIVDSNISEIEDFTMRLEWIERFHSKDIEKIKESEGNLINYSLFRNYKGGKSRKENRGYFNLCIETKNNGEGKRRFVLLLIADTNIIHEQNALNLFKKVLKLSYKN